MNPKRALRLLSVAKVNQPSDNNNPTIILYGIGASLIIFLSIFVNLPHPTDDARSLPHKTKSLQAAPLLLSFIFFVKITEVQIFTLRTSDVFLKHKVL